MTLFMFSFCLNTKMCFKCNNYITIKIYFDINILPGGPYNKRPFHGDKIPLNNCGYCKRKKKRFFSK